MRQTASQTKWLTIAVLSLMICARPAFADDNVQDLKKQVEDLKAKVSELEARQQQRSAQQGQGWQAPIKAEGDQWDPFAEMERMHSEMGQMVRQAFGEPFSPRHGMFSDNLFFDSSRIEETKDGYLIKLDIAGFDKDKININVKDGSLAISGEYTNDKKQNDKNRAFESHDYGQFLNTMPLPKDADVSKMKTEKKGDTLEISFPKKT